VVAPIGTMGANNEAPEVPLSDAALTKLRAMYKKQKKEETPIVIKHKVSVMQSQVESLDITVPQKEEAIKRE